MTRKNDHPCDALERIFHEPNRLSIMSALCAAEGGLTFNELKDACRLTDGNLNRHLKVLAAAKAVTVRKEFVSSKPRTTLFLSTNGMARFEEYLRALSDVLEKARSAMPREEKKAAAVAGITAKATAH